MSTNEGILQIISGSDGTLLQFHTSEEFAEYYEMKRLLEDEMYAKLRAKYGVWASNQGKYVESVQEFNDWDSVTMELRFLKRNENE